jgi:hypothetical protein
MPDEQRDKQERPDDSDLPLDLAALRADDDLIEALSAGLVPPPSGPIDLEDTQAALTHLLSGWVAGVRPESLLHPPGSGEEVSFARKTRDGKAQIKMSVSVGPVGEPARQLSWRAFYAIEAAQLAFFVIMFVLALMVH